MKSLFIFQIHDHMEYVQYEINNNTQYEINSKIFFQLNGNGELNLTEENQDKINSINRKNSFAFIIGNENMLNQQRLSAYMAIKRLGLPITSIQSIGSSIDKSVRLRENVYVDHAVRIQPNANIGSNTWILQGSDIGASSKIGTSCWIGRYCKISERAIIGKNCTLGDGIVIGEDVEVPDWSVITNYGTTIKKSPSTTIFKDPRFRGDVYLFNRI